MAIFCLVVFIISEIIVWNNLEDYRKIEKMNSDELTIEILSSRKSLNLVLMHLVYWVSDIVILFTNIWYVGVLLLILSFSRSTKLRKWIYTGSKLDFILTMLIIGLGCLGV